MSDWLSWLPLAGGVVCLVACRRAVRRVLGLERLHAQHVARSVRGRASEPETVDAARKVR